MSSIIRLLQLSFIPTSADLGLLVFRVWIAGSMLALHGWGKLINFQSYSASFADPLGVGSQLSLILALCGEVLCPLLIILGFVTRVAALGAAVTMGVAWASVHKLALTGPHSGELAYIFLAGFVLLVFAGAGRFSLDGAAASASTTRIRPQPPRK